MKFSFSLKEKESILFRYSKHTGVPPAFVTTHSFSHNYLLSIYSVPGMVLSFRENVHTYIHTYIHTHNYIIKLTSWNKGKLLA